MKTNFKFLTLFAFVGLTLFSCGSDDDDNPPTSAPVIVEWEYGSGSSHSTNQVAFVGTDVHIEAEIYAEAIVSSITVEIHSDDVLGAWEYEQIFNDASYQAINVDFHEHFDIPATIPVGEYHVELIVEDMLGNITEVEGYLDILDTISMSNFEINTPVQRGTEIHTEFDIFALYNIQSVTIEIEGEDLTVGPGEVEWEFEQTYTEGLQGLMEAGFVDNILVPADAPAGEYHVEIEIEDSTGMYLEYATHIDITE